MAAKRDRLLCPISWCRARKITIYENEMYFQMRMTVSKFIYDKIDRVHIKKEVLFGEI